MTNQEKKWAIAQLKIFIGKYGLTKPREIFAKLSPAHEQKLDQILCQVY